MEAKNANASYIKNGQKVGAVVTFIDGTNGQEKPVTNALAEYLAEVFTDGTASAYSAKRLAMANGLLANAAALASVESFKIESDVETITIDASELAELLTKIVAGQELNREFRQAVAGLNDAYAAAVVATSKEDKANGTRGRKARDLANVTLALE